MPSKDSTSTSDTANDGPRWQSLSIFIEESVEDDYKDFFITLKANHREIRDFEKRLIQQALIETAMDYPDEVADTAFEISERVDDSTTWKQTNLYLPQTVRGRFNDVFFGRLKVENDELYSVMKRVLQESALVVGMEHPEEVAERAVEVNEEYGSSD